jgi:two-component system LytT family sensor kinase
LLHVFTWLFAAFLNLRSFSLLARPQMLSVYLSSTFFILFSFYIFYFLFVPYFLEKRKYFWFIFVSLTTLGFLPFSGYSLLFLIRSYYENNFKDFYGHYSLSMHFSGLVVMTISATFGSFFKVFLNWLNAVNQKEVLEKQKAESELALLKSKINPHFLFNTLNNIDVLIYENPDRASQALLKLSDIMRYMSYETVSEYVSLSKEIGYISNLVGLYKLRISNPELIRLDIPGNYPDLKIAPMLFIPFIENAFKYATFKGNNPGFEIKFEIEKGKVKFKIVNHYDNAEKETISEHGGTGINNVKQRLEYIYPNKHKLDINNKDGLFKVDLIIDTDGD